MKYVLGNPLVLILLASGLASSTDGMLRADKTQGISLGTSPTGETEKARHDVPTTPHFAIIILNICCTISPMMLQLQISL
jgi:hypothetical protein